MKSLTSPRFARNPGTTALGIPILLATALLSPMAGAATLEAKADRNRIASNETLLLTVTLDRTNVGGQPHFEVLDDDFEVRRRSQQTSINSSNGKVTNTVTWFLNLAPRRAGQLTIPPIVFGNLRTKSIAVTVHKVEANKSLSGDVSLEIRLERDRIHVQQQLLLTVIYLRRTDLRSPRLNKPKLVDARMTQAGRQADFTRDINGVRYLVTEVVFAIFPERSGELKIPPFTLVGRRPAAPNRNRPYSVPSQTIQLQTPEKKVRVLPRPSSYPNNAAWLPATSLSLNYDKLPRKELEAGESLSLRIELEAEGLEIAQLPPLEFPKAPGLKLYVEPGQSKDQLTNRGYRGRRVSSLVLVTERPGTFKFPGLAIPWWDVNADKLRTARLPAFDIQVTAPSGARPPPDSPAETDGATTAASPLPTGWWPWLTGLLALAWLVTLVSWWLGLNPPGRGREWRNRRSEPAPLPSPGKAARQLTAACHHGDALAARNALEHWARARFPELGSRQLTHLAARHPGLAAALDDLNSAIYGEAPAPEGAGVPAGGSGAGEDTNVHRWQGGEALVAVIAELNRGASAGAQSTPALPPLYPRHSRPQTS